MTKNREIKVPKDELIISKTDLRGNITYANRVFMRIANYSESELLGHPHNIIRHPDMPRGAYYLMWKTLKAKKEFFAFVKNLTADGNFYWVFANVTPDYFDGKVEGYFSVRRTAPPAALEPIKSVYQKMLEIEQRTSADKAPAASYNWLLNYVESEFNLSYEELVLSLYEDNL